jgi:carbonic anhydrase
VPTGKILAGYRRFKRKFDDDEEVFRRLAEEGQDPKVLWIGCSDSRVIPELITGAEAGELFDVRNIANVVPPADDQACATGAAVEYAVIHLGVRHIVVCGHTECGGIKALESEPNPDGQPHIEAWLELARPARMRVLQDGIPEEEQYLETIKTNVLLQCGNLRSYPCVAAREGTGELSIHAWLYDLHTGNISAFEPTNGCWGELAGPPTDSS